MTVEEAIEQERLRDELRAIMAANVYQRPDETYEENLMRRARLRVRESEILSKLSW